MSFSPDIFRSKLDSLQETQDSIVSISQWVLFHHRRAKDLCQIWSDYILGSSPPVPSRKRLSLLYLCNDVVQQARHKRKPEFIENFAGCLPQVFNEIYPSTDNTIKPKLDRLIGVWEQRGIFSASVIRSMRRGIDLLKAGKSLKDNASTDDSGDSNTAITAPSAAAGPKIATELVHLNNLYNHLDHLLDVCLSNLTQIGHQSKAYLPTDHEQNDNLPLPRVYISKLNVLERLCNMTSKTLLDIKTARSDILAALSGLQSSLQNGLSTDESKESIITQRLQKLHETRSSLQEMLDEEPEDEPQPPNPEPVQPKLLQPSAQLVSLKNPHRPQKPPAPQKEEPSPSFEPAYSNDDDDDLVPTYENSDSDDDDNDNKPVQKQPPRVPERDESEDQSAKRAKTSDLNKKSVAFSEDIQVKEYDREEQTEEVNIAKSDNESDEGDDAFEPQLPHDMSAYESTHKDDLELKKANDSDDGYEPEALNGDGGEEPKSGLLDLLSKLS